MPGLSIAGNEIPPLPLDFITESSAILAKKGAGKTNAALVLLEEAYRAGVPVVSIDPKGDHWGLRAGSAEFPDAGLPIPVFGGLHGDVPLEATAGAYLADLVRSKRLSAVLDVSEFTGGERARFLTAFAERLYKYDSRDPMLLVLEEAHEYIPQFVTKDDAKMVGAFERIVKLGRSKGLGVVMVTQRSASLNKNVLTQTDNLFVMRTTSPQDRDQVKAWISTHAESSSIMAELPSLGTGECWLWQPERGEPIKFRWRMRHTYDAGATPKVGEKPRPQPTLADIDLGEISEAMAATIEKAKADDPRALRMKVAELEKQLRERPAGERVEVPVEVVREVEKIVEVPALAPDERQVLETIQSTLGGLAEMMPTYRLIVGKVREAQAVRPSRPVFVPEPRATVTRIAPPVKQPVQVVEGDAAPLGKAARTILTVLATYGQRTHVQLAILSGYSSKSGGFRNTISAQRTAGNLEGTRDSLSITDTGLGALGEYDPLPSGQALIDHWKGQVGQQHRAILDALLSVYPRSLTQDEVAEVTGYQPTSGGFRNSVSKLRTLELIHGGRDALYASDTLGEAAAA